MNFEKMVISHFQKIGAIKRRNAMKEKKDFKKAFKALLPNICKNFWFDVVNKHICSVADVLYFL